MDARIKNVLASSSSWLGRRPAYMLLTAGSDQLAAEPAERFERAWAGLMLLSVGWGIGMAVLWEISFRVFGWYSGMFLVPVAAVVAANALWLYRRSLLAAAELLGGADPAGRGLAAAVLVVVLTMLLLGLKGVNEDWATYLHPSMQWTRPRAMYRALMLGPVWGAWAMLIICQFCKPDERTCPAVAALRRGCGPFQTAGCLALPLGGSVWYFNYLPWTQLSISAAAMAAAVVGGCLLCRRAGRLCHSALLAANIITQLVFMLAFLANR